MCSSDALKGLLLNTRKEVVTVLMDLPVNERKMAWRLMSSMVADGNGLLCRYKTDRFVRSADEVELFIQVAKTLQKKNILRLVDSVLEVEYHAPLTVKAARESNVDINVNI